MPPERVFKDASMNNPAVKAYRDKFRKCPNAGLRKDIVVTVQDLALWLRILNGWRYQIQDRWKAKNPLAVKEMLTEYELQITKQDEDRKRREPLREHIEQGVSERSSRPVFTMRRTASGWKG